jgi:hypothetical protein
LGQTVTGQLRGDRDPLIADGRHGQAWAFDGRAGQRIVVELEADHDSYLYLIGPGIVEPLEDDDGGEGLHSRIETTLSGSGTYRVIASSLSQAEGTYSLRVTPQ